MDSAKEIKGALKKLILFIAVEVLLIMAVTWFFDPFYQYHEPFASLQVVLNDHDNQMPGSIRTLSYDSVLVGTSVAENFDSSVLDTYYDCKTLKIIRGSGSVADQLYYLKMAHEARDIRNVFWCLDLFSLEKSTEVTLYDESVPRYLHTESVLDDVTYLLNKDVIFMKIPLMVASSFQGFNTGGNGYNWSKGKVFGFFYSTWGINFTLLGNALADANAPQEVGNGIFGDYAVCEGPQAYYWGGTWICAATGTDNTAVIADIMKKLTCDTATMKQITLDTQDYTNNKAAMDEIANDASYGSAFLGGQNHIALFAAAAGNIDCSNISAYDQLCNENFQQCMNDYFMGTVDKATALNNFYTKMKDTYPELNVPQA